MCFSAQASFTAAATLAIIGLAALKKAKIQSARLFAAIPFFFALQQICEGFVWITLNNSDTTSLLHLSAMYGFLFFASVFWPTYIPYTLSLLEQNQSRKKILTYITYLGCFVGLVSIAGLVLFGIKAQVHTGHIAYPFISNHPIVKPGYYITLLLYCVATIGAFFVSTVKHMWTLGFLIAIAFVIAQLFYFFTFGSIWCFFAALASIIIYAIVNAHTTS